MAEAAKVIDFQEAREKILQRRREVKAAEEEARRANLKFEVALNIVPAARPRLIIASPKYGDHNLPLGATGIVKIDEILNSYADLGWDGTYVWGSDFTQLLSKASNTVRAKIIRALGDLGLTPPWT